MVNDWQVNLHSLTQILEILDSNQVIRFYFPIVNFSIWQTEFLSFIKTWANQHSSYLPAIRQFLLLLHG